MDRRRRFPVWRLVILLIVWDVIVNESSASAQTYKACIEKCDNISKGGNLDCENSHLSSIPREDSCLGASLRALKLRNNQIRQLESGAFKDFDGLKIIILADNEIMNIPSGVFDDTAMLEALLLQRNNLTVLPRGVFTGLQSLVRLILTNNQLAEITTGVFDSLASVNLLRVEWNQIATIESGSFQGMTELGYLYLTGNRIRRVESGTFSGLSNLKFLDLSKNRIETLDSGAFTSLTSLEELRLNSNRITTVSSAIVEPPSLTTLYLQDNLINTIGDSNFLLDKLKQDQPFTIRIEKNPLFCDCSMEPLRLWYLKAETDVQATCQLPAEYSEVRLNDTRTPFQCLQGNDVTTPGFWQPEQSVDDPNSPGTIITIILVCGFMVLIVFIMIVMRRHELRKRAMKPEKHLQTSYPIPPLVDAAEEPQDYSTHVDVNTRETSPPSIRAFRTCHQTEPVTDESSIFLHHEEYLRPTTADGDEGHLEEERGKWLTPNGRSTSNGRSTPSSRLLQHGAVPTGSRPPESRPPPPPLPSLKPDPVCRIDFNESGEAVISPVNDDEDGLDIPRYDINSTEYAKPFHKMSPRVINSQDYIVPYAKPINSY